MMTESVSFDDFDKARQVQALYRETIKGGTPLPVQAAMIAVVRDNFDGLAASHGREKATATLLEVAFMAGMEAARQGLTFEEMP